LAKPGWFLVIDFDGILRNYGKIDNQPPFLYIEYYTSLRLGIPKSKYGCTRKRSAGRECTLYLLISNDKKMAEAHQDQSFVEYVVRALVDNPDAVQSERTVDEMGVLITLKVDQKDLGQVIGRNGQTAKSIRTLLRVVGAKNQARVNLKIYEPEGSRKPARPMTSTPSPVQEEDTSAIDDLKL
jgi:hypothetical protein